VLFDKRSACRSSRRLYIAAHPRLLFVTERGLVEKKPFRNVHPRRAYTPKQTRQ